MLLGGAYQTVAGNYIDTLVGGSFNGCDSILTTTLSVLSPPTGSTAVSICQGDSMLLGGAYQTVAGNYVDTLVGASFNGCDSILTTTLSVLSPPTGSTTATICQGDSILLGGAYQTVAGNYVDTLVGASFNGCDSILSTTLTVTSPSIVMASNDTSICLGYPLILTATTTGNGTITWYSDASGTTIIGTGNPFSPTISNTGTVTYYVNEVNTCSSLMDSVTITVGGVNAVINPSPISGIVPLNVLFGNGSTTGSGITYTWDFGDGNSSTVFEPSNVYNNTEQFNVTFIITDGLCYDTAFATIDVFGASTLIVPNVFTPNGDGNNDVFKVEGTSVESIEGEIYNRWGEKLFSWDTLNGAWDGRTSSGKETPDGTYFYIIKAKGLDGVDYLKKGAFSLIR